MPVTMTRLTFLLLAATLPGAVFAADLTTPPSKTTSPTQVGYYRENLGHTGVSAESLTAPLALRWRHTALAAPNNAASPVYSGTTVYFASGGTLFALNSSDGATLWQYPADGKPGPAFSTTPAIADGFVYATNDGAQVVKLAAQTGKEVWKVKLDGALRSAPVISDGTVFFGSSNSHCYAVSAETGQTLWDVATNGTITGSPTVTGGLVVFTSADDTVYSLNTRTGRKAWSVPFDSDPSIVPVAYDGRTVYITAGDTIYSLDPNSGRQRTTLKLPTNVLIPPTITPETDYVITQSSVLYALRTGGRERWKATLDSAPTAAPLLAGNLLIVPTQSGVISGYDTAGGGLVWRYVMQATATDSQAKPAAANVFAAPIVADGTLYVVSDDGTLSAFRQDAVDTIGPEILLLAPASGSTVAPTGLTYGAMIVDTGSGINPATVSLELDGKPDPLALFHANANAIYDTPTTPLTEGDHQITIKATDWRGNASTQNWHFTIQNGGGNRGRFNPFGRGFGGGGGQNPNAPPPPPAF